MKIKVKIAKKLLPDMFQLSEWMKCINGIPDDSRFIGVEFDTYHVIFVFESSSVDADSEIVPMWEIQYEDR